MTMAEEEGALTPPQRGWVGGGGGRREWQPHIHIDSRHGTHDRNSAQVPLAWRRQMDVSTLTLTTSNPTKRFRQYSHRHAMETLHTLCVHTRAGGQHPGADSSSHQDSHRATSRVTAAKSHIYERRRSPNHRRYSQLGRHRHPEESRAPSNLPRCRVGDDSTKAALGTEPAH